MIKLPAYFTGYRRRKDRSASLSFSTQEISSDELKKIDELVMEESFGWLLFDENNVTAEDVPDQIDPDEPKSASQRLRNVIYAYWAESGKKREFHDFYRLQMEAIIEKYKERLDG